MHCFYNYIILFLLDVNYYVNFDIYCLYYYIYMDLSLITYDIRLISFSYMLFLLFIIYIWFYLSFIIFINYIIFDYLFNS